MSKLLKLKSWLSLEEGAKTISTLLGESVDISDLYRFALDGHINLSINLINPTPVRKVSVIRTEDLQHKTVKLSHKSLPQNLRANVPIAEYPISNKYWVESESKDWNNVKGVYDLAMIGAEQNEIAQLIHSESIVKIPVISGFYIKKGEQIYKLQVLQRPARPHAQSTQSNDESGVKDKVDSTLRGLKPRILPQAVSASSIGNHEHELVLRTEEVTSFIQSSQDEPVAPLRDDKPLAARERNTLLTLIGAFCKQLDIDPSARGVTSAVQSMTELTGAPLSDDSIRKILSQIEPALERRQK